MDLKGFFKEKGYDVSDHDTMAGMIKTWQSWYQGNVSNFHNYSIYNSGKRLSKKRHSMQMAKKVCEDWANLLMNEKVELAIEKNEALLDVLNENNFWVQANQAVELAFALGTGAFVISLNDITYDKVTDVFDMGTSKISIEFVSADKCYILSHNQKQVTECAFVVDKVIDNQKFKYVSMHILDDGENYVIKNYMLKVGKSGNLTDMTECIPDMLQEVATGEKNAWFSFLKPNLINNSNIETPYGMSVFGNGLDVLKSIDTAYDSMNNEFVNGRKRIFASAEMWKPDENGNQTQTFDPDDISIYQLPPDMDSKSLIQDATGELRIEQHRIAIELNLNILSSKSGFGEKHYKFDSGGITTATQVVSENSTLFRTLKKHEIVMEQCLLNLFDSIMRISNKYLGTSFDMNEKIKINFDDSIIEDKNAEMVRDLQLVNSGILSKVEFRVKHFGETDAEAIKALPKEPDIVI